MNAQDYISSGLLEAYVLGSLSLAESEQVAGAVCRFPEVAAEIASIEAMLIYSAELEAIEPPAGMEDKIWAAIQASSGSTATAAPHQKTIVPPVPAAEQQGPLLIPLQNKARSLDFSWASAAVWLLLAGSLVANYMFWNGRNSDRKELAVMEQRLDTMNRQQQDLAANLERYRQEAEMASEPGTQPVAMRSMLPGHPMAATIYWNKARSEAYVSVQKLPPAPDGMQYQLWAIADGKPVSIGMLDNDIVVRGGMQKVPQAVTGGQAFAVSLEKEGGNATPTPDKIFLMGKTPA